jgi:DNA-binding transcriptional MocR family regulator
LLSLSQAELEQQQEQALQYGVDAGNLDMLQAVVQLRQQCASAQISADSEEGDPDNQGEAMATTSTPRITTDNLLITNGSSQGLDMVCLRFSQPGDIILVEPLSYCYIATTLEQHGLIPMKVPSTSEQRRTSCLEESRGNLLDLDALEDALEARRQANGLMPKLLYLCPICHNPTATTMEEEEAKRLIAIARKYKFKLISDEVRPACF